jgi:hypothetical protein
MALGSTQPLTERSTRNLPVGKGRPARKDDITADGLEYVGVSTSHNPTCLHCLLQRKLYLSFCGTIFIDQSKDTTTHVLQYRRVVVTDKATQQDTTKQLQTTKRTVQQMLLHAAEIICHLPYSRTRISTRSS